MVYSLLFPSPTSGNPATLQAHITKNIIPEVRLETVAFYGPFDCIESQYPGLDYSNVGHRLRLSRFPWHRRLFRVFDALRLTKGEIHHLCRWEGTKWARERYEKDEGCKIKDTTWDGIEAYTGRHSTRIVTTRYTVPQSHEGEFVGEQEDENMDEGEYEYENDEEEEEGGDRDGDGEDMGAESEDGVVSHSVGVELNQRLFLASEASARGEEVELNPAWEQWLKEAAERGTLPEMLSLINSGPSRQTSDNTAGWGQIIPEAFRYGPGMTASPHVAALQAQMSPPPLYPLLNNTQGINGASSAPSTGTAT